MDSFHTIGKKRKKRLADLTPNVELILRKIEKSQLLEKEESEYLKFSIEYIMFIMNKYKNIEELDI